MAKFTINIDIEIDVLDYEDAEDLADEFEADLQRHVSVDRAMVNSVEEN